MSSNLIRMLGEIFSPIENAEWDSLLYRDKENAIPPARISLGQNPLKSERETNILKRKKISVAEEGGKKKFKLIMSQNNSSLDSALIEMSPIVPSLVSYTNQNKMRSAKINGKSITLSIDKKEFLYTIKDQINAGSEGIIYKATTTSGKTPKIVKELRYGITPLDQNSPEFHAIYMKDGMPIKPKGLIVPRKAICMNKYSTLFEIYAQYECDLTVFLKTNTINNKLLVFIMKDTLAGLTHCHAVDCTWDDIKEANILTRKKKGERQFVLGDPTIRGKASARSNDYMSTAGYLNINDSLRFSLYSDINLKWEIRKKMNVYSLGIVFMNTLKIPYKYSDLTITKTDSEDKQIDYELCKIINDMIRNDATSRCSAAEAYNRVLAYLESNPTGDFDPLNSCAVKNPPPPLNGNPAEDSNDWLKYLI